MTNSIRTPYSDCPAEAFWKTAVTEANLTDFDPVTNVPFRISKLDRVATAGSCFAQHISKALVAEGVHFLQTEKAAPADADKLPVYSARYGNIYSCRQLLQLFQRAYSLFAPFHTAWRRADGRYVDPFRQNEFPAGFASVGEVERATEHHLAAVREVFEACDVFVFTLGLTEVWLSDGDGAAVPLPPGVVAAPVDGAQTFSPANLSVQELTDDLLAFIDGLRLVNPKARLVVTVSPVPLVATFEDRHVLESNTYSKAVLRVVAEAVANQRRNVLYFPSYEMIVANPKARYFEDNYRSVRREGVDAVMKVFRRRILGEETPRATASAPDRRSGGDRRLSLEERFKMPDRKTLSEPARSDAPPLEAEFKGAICDEEMLAR